MADFFVAPPQRAYWHEFRRRALKSPHFLASKLDSVQIPHSYHLITNFVCLKSLIIDGRPLLEIWGYSLSPTRVEYGT